ncbi:hypothetical protein BDK51DRAFT_39425 [Blyttiomyces helicus]|uniref:Uncharacterized protein n=1 Tax=Blyttiomyces helicus TaxID=388810 RepID=A0A4P9VZM8_9FUNG|nr:hypothetical protein BDK51DRAFT_39425 [Blyttiomyces helicus]|eukprot:RKO83286.1 hypothetical protein BDK51DRAFT_39425 [Blyttiomyces helicus]
MFDEGGVCLATAAEPVARRERDVPVREGKVARQVSFSDKLPRAKPIDRRPYPPSPVPLKTAPLEYFSIPSRPPHPHQQPSPLPPSPVIELPGQALMYGIHVPMLDRPTEARELLDRNAELFTSIRHACCPAESDWTEFVELFTAPRERIDDLEYIRKLRRRLGSEPALFAALRERLGLSQFCFEDEGEPKKLRRGGEDRELEREGQVDMRGGDRDWASSVEIAAGARGNTIPYLGSSKAYSEFLATLRIPSEEMDGREWKRAMEAFFPGRRGRKLRHMFRSLVGIVDERSGEILGSDEDGPSPYLLQRPAALEIPTKYRSDPLSPLSPLRASPKPMRDDPSPPRASTRDQLTAFFPHLEMYCQIKSAIGDEKIFIRMLHSYISRREAMKYQPREGDDFPTSPVDPSATTTEIWRSILCDGWGEGSQPAQAFERLVDEGGMRNFDVINGRAFSSWFATAGARCPPHRYTDFFMIILHTQARSLPSDVGNSWEKEMGCAGNMQNARAYRRLGVALAMRLV